MRTRRYAAIAALVAAFAAFLFVAFRYERDSVEFMVGIAAGMVLGTLGFGIALVSLKCPDCGAGLGRDASRQDTAADATVVLLRPARCERCGFAE